MAKSSTVQYKKELAIKLIKYFGLTGAKQTCVRNNWSDVLSMIDEVSKGH